MDNLISISAARAKLPSLVSRADKYMERITITVKGEPKATLISAEELESLEETTEILETPGAKEDIMEGLKQAKKGLGIPMSKLK